MKIILFSNKKTFCLFTIRFNFSTQRMEHITPKQEAPERSPGIFELIDQLEDIVDNLTSRYW